MQLLIFGGTGTLGRQIVRQALDEGYQVKCFTRNLRRASFLKEWGAQLIYGDLSLPETIPPALKNISLIIDAATVRPTDDYNSDVIDWNGKIALIEAAKLAQVKNIVFFSMFGASINSSIPLIDLKLKIKKVLNGSKLSCTIFSCSGFFQGVINQYAIPILEKKRIWLVGDSTPIAYLDTQDAAKVVVKNLNSNEPGLKDIPLLGKSFWTSEEVISLCERLSGKKANIVYIPKFILQWFRYFFRFFEFTWNIADRLHFAELNVKSLMYNYDNNKSLETDEYIGLENYLQEYFGKILKKLKETNYQQQNNEISFL
jgi:uncharacterized protein YbjT (DUF2867 family)